jgi:glyoxalase family protein
MKLLGLHHVTAITGNSKANFNFYTKVLMMRVIKRTVNFDDPSVYHLYYSDKIGSPGSLMTFFGYEGSHKKTDGFGSAHKVQFSVPNLKVYEENFKKLNYKYEKEQSKLKITDPDGLELELIEDKNLKDIKITSIYANSNAEDFYDFLSFKEYSLPDGFKFKMTNSNKPSIQGAGSIHHVALSIKDAKEQEEFRENLILNQINVSPIMERFYFKSIYFQDPNGLLLEIATKGPGMHIDEEIAGTNLVLPAWLEKHREQILTLLPKIE